MFESLDSNGIKIRRDFVDPIKMLSIFVRTHLVKNTTEHSNRKHATRSEVHLTVFGVVRGGISFDEQKIITIFINLIRMMKTITKAYKLTMFLLWSTSITF